MPQPTEPPSWGRLNYLKRLPAPVICGSATTRSLLPAGSAKDPGSGRLGYLLRIVLRGGCKKTQAPGKVPRVWADTTLKQRGRGGCVGAFGPPHEGHVASASYSKNTDKSVDSFFLKQS